MYPPKIAATLAALCILSLSSAYAQGTGAKTTMTITWKGTKSGSVTVKEGSPAGRIVYTDSNNRVNGSGSLPDFPTYVNVWTADGAVRAPADAVDSALGGRFGPVGAISNGTLPLAVGSYPNAVGLFSTAAHDGQQHPTISIGNVDVGGPCSDDVAGSFKVSTIEAEQLANRLHVTRLVASIDGTCSASGPAFHVDIDAQEPSLGGTTSTPPGGGGGGGGGGTGGTPTPPPAPTTPVVTFPDGFFDQQVGIGNAQSVRVPFSVFVPDGFSNDVTLSASSTPDGLALAFDNSFFPAPGSGDAVLTISAGPDTFPIDRQVAVTATFNDANGLPVSSTTTFTVSLFCDPPMILGLDQPKNSAVASGSSANLSVTPTGSGPFHYQWYAGSTGQTHFPVSNATSRTFATPPVTAETLYWVRISNACGSADSNTVVVTPK